LDVSGSESEVRFAISERADAAVSVEIEVLGRWQGQVGE
jgi:hypothetical protein